jgi:hypothetical protein
MAITKFKAVRTLDELHKRVQNHTKRFGLEGHDVWFRGQGQLRYDLTAGLFRRKQYDRNVEHNLIADFTLQGHRFIPKEASSWEILSTMQHWGTPTRMLDWTTSLNNALYFALSGNTDNPTIWMLNPYSLNEKAYGHRVIYDLFDKPPYEYEKALRSDVWPHETPMALAIPWTNERIERQAGYFTVQGQDRTPINEVSIVKSTYKAIVIHNDLVADLRKYLIKQDVHPFKLFPDLEGLSGTLKWKYGYVH